MLPCAWRSPGAQERQSSHMNCPLPWQPAAPGATPESKDRELMEETEQLQEEWMGWKAGGESGQSPHTTTS